MPRTKTAELVRLALAKAGIDVNGVDVESLLRAAKAESKWMPLKEIDWEQYARGNEVILKLTKRDAARIAGSFPDVKAQVRRPRKK